MIISRRNILLGSASLPLTLSLSPNFINQDNDKNKNILILLHAKGGMDGLQLIAPSNDKYYRRARKNFGLFPYGSEKGLNLKSSIGNTNFLMNSNANELYKLFNSKKLAIIHAVGSPTETKSHFKASQIIDNGGIKEDSVYQKGWLNRYLESKSLNRKTHGNKNLPGSFIKLDNNLEVHINEDRTVTQNIKSSDFNKDIKFDNIETNAGYSNGPLSRTLKKLALAINNKINIDTATVNHCGWDHHNNLPTEFNKKIKELSISINAFWNDVEAHRDRITLVVMTEFGRQLKPNHSNGTDHGSGSIMMVLSNEINGGKIFGKWPGLSPDQLSADGGLAITTDYRQIISEAIEKKSDNIDIRKIFPSLSYKPIGVFNKENDLI